MVQSIEISLFLVILDLNVCCTATVLTYLNGVLGDEGTSESEYPTAIL